LVLVLVLLGFVPVTLSRFLVFEAHGSTPFEVFAPNRLPWTLFVALPLCAAVVLLLIPGDRPRARVVGFGLVLGAGLCLVETATYWTLYFFAAQGSYLAGPAVRFLLAGALVVFAAGVLALIMVPVSRPTVVRRDARLAWAAVVLAGAAIPISMTPLHAYAGWWGTNGGTVMLAVAALGLVLLRPAPEHRVAGLVAIAVLAGWRAWFPLQQLVEPSVDKPVRLLVVLIAGHLLVLAAGLLVDAALPAASPRQHSGEAGYR
jgi:hypothetical protein